MKLPLLSPLILKQRVKNLQKAKTRRVERRRAKNSKLKKSRTREQRMLIQ